MTLSHLDREKLTVPRRASSIPLEQKFRTGALLSVPEFSEWADLSIGTVYAEIRSGRLKLTKIGRAARVAAPDALAWRDALRTAVA